ncbi:Outer membrane protein beta-barrel domain-containing protein [Pustulibacterium marinum]|uniref:Outer membrane protein beta-barrel domain-containing protein n=1 Tax=Pustulibacterium marinum TaxID=1224947 RepID=A0A1I7ICT7_9FLAO|nr:outer membrane beta-barrel protein [Pustulibacterium marinum]SFU70727.1 Outer membrane protein beta-barrel domain-containing protein [Pustulibacterium marinum]
MKKEFTIKLLLTLIISILFANFNFAQDTKKGFDFTFKSGLMLANQYGKDAESETFLNGDSPENFYANNPASKKLKSGVSIGGLIEFRFNKRLSLGLGANYIQKGSKINATNHWNSETQEYENVDGTIKWIQNYWTIDLPLKIYFPIKQNEIHILGGLTFGHLINSKEKGDIKISENKYDYTNDRGANKNEQGFLVGIGYNYLLPNKKNHLILEFIWNRSFGKSYGGDLIPNPQKYYNQTFNLSFGYKFDFNNKK